MTAPGIPPPADSEGSSAKHYRTGTHRTVPPASTLARLKPYLSEMGITRLANVTGLDRVGIPVVMAMRPNSRSVAVSQGKGVDLEAAKASALMESVETWHAERIALPTLYGSVADLSGEAALADLEMFPKTRSSRFDPTLLAYLSCRGMWWSKVVASRSITSQMAWHCASTNWFPDASPLVEQGKQPCPGGVGTV